MSARSNGSNKEANYKRHKSPKKKKEPSLMNRLASIMPFSNQTKVQKQVYIRRRPSSADGTFNKAFQQKQHQELADWVSDYEHFQL